jgi:hypothetical protein
MTSAPISAAPASTPASTAWVNEFVFQNPKKATFLTTSLPPASGASEELSLELESAGADELSLELPPPQAANVSAKTDAPARVRSFPDFT